MKKKNNEKPILKRIGDLQMQLRDAKNNAKKNLARPQGSWRTISRQAGWALIEFTYERDMLSVD